MISICKMSSVDSYSFPTQVEIVKEILNSNKVIVLVIVQVQCQKVDWNVVNSQRKFGEVRSYKIERILAEASGYSI